MDSLSEAGEMSDMDARLTELRDAYRNKEDRESSLSETPRHRFAETSPESGYRSRASSSYYLHDMNLDSSFDTSERTSAAELSKSIDEEIKSMRAQLSDMKIENDRLRTPLSNPMTSQPQRRVTFSDNYPDVPNHPNVTKRHSGSRPADICKNPDFESESNSGQLRTSTVKVKASTFDGTTAWRDYKSHFEACSRINRWTEKDKGLYLAVSLRGQAQGILGDLPVRLQEDYQSLVTALEERFAPPNQNELYRIQLLERRQKAAETLPELGQAIRRLVNLAYPTVPSDVRDTLAKQQFIEALVDSEMRIRIKQSRPVNLTDAIHLAVELEAYNRAEKIGKEGRSHLRSASAEVGEQSTLATVTTTMETASFKSTLERLEEKLDSLQKEVNSIKGKTLKKKDSPPQKKRCFKCGEEGHIRPNCPKKKTNNDMASKPKDSTKPSANPLQTRRKRKQSAGIGTSSAVHEAGLYVKANVQGLNTKLLVDTGATITLISKEVYDRLPTSVKPTLRKVEQDILAANGTSRDALGKGGLSLNWRDVKKPTSRQ